MNETLIAACHSVRISRPFDVVTQQLLGLEDQLLRDAAVAATGQGEASPHRGRAPTANGALDVDLRVGVPNTEQGLFALPLTWRVSGGPLPCDLSGEFEVRAVTAREAQVAFRMVSAVGAHLDTDEEARARRMVEVATRSFLNRVFWTLEARSRLDLPPPTSAESRTM